MIILGAFSRQVSLPLKIITPDLTEEQQEIINKDLKDQIQRYKRHHDLSTTEGVKSLIKFIIKSYNVSVESLGIGCLEMIVQCPNLKSLERLWRDCCSGVLDNIAEQYLVTSELKRKLDLQAVKMKTTITQENYLMCKRALVEIEGQFLDLIDYEQASAQSPAVLKRGSAASAVSRLTTLAAQHARHVSTLQEIFALANLFVSLNYPWAER